MDPFASRPCASTPLNYNLKHPPSSLAKPDPTPPRQHRVLPALLLTLIAAIWLANPFNPPTSAHTAAPLSPLPLEPAYIAVEAVLDALDAGSGHTHLSLARRGLTSQGMSGMGLLGMSQSAPSGSAYMLNYYGGPLMLAPINIYVICEPFLCGHIQSLIILIHGALAWM
ncbi:hypothetical protein BC830DRAFT_432312 [Chytriomyces sp. MP71]|nr:hypothetical protein BC830DRAFT_432312 [Chytriomyces sp. MP71]